MDELQRFLTLWREGLLLLFCWGTEAVGTTIITAAAESESNWGRLDPEVQPSCSEQGQLEQAAHSCVHLGSEHPQAWKHCSLSGQCVPVLNCPYRTQNRLFI